jgi:hypothetical protein
VRRLVLLVAAVVLVGTLAACGGSGGKSSTTSGENAQAEIKNAFVKFFSSKTPLAQRVALLQNGTKYKPIIEALAKNPLASDTSATVKSVRLEGKNQASVVYTVFINGAPLPQLRGRTGTAVKADGTWQVGDASFCQLVAIGGSTPAVCNHPT